MFAIEIEYLLRVSFAARASQKEVAEWPPHPDRVFLALVAAWGESGSRPDGADALRWLEAQDPPDIRVPETNSRDEVVSFVPVSGPGDDMVDVLSKERPVLQIPHDVKRKERRFPATILPDDEPKAYMVWRNADPSQGTRLALSDLASRVSHIGHSASVTRVAVTENFESEPSHVCDDAEGDVNLRCPHEGRFDSLVAGFGGGLGSGLAWRPSAAPPRKYRLPFDRAVQSAMGGGDEWVTLAFRGQTVPTLLSFPAVAKRMRDAIMHNVDGPIHGIISGHKPDGSYVEGPHLAIVPMANVGWGPYSDGSLIGMSMILPKKSGYGTGERKQLRQAVSKFLTPGEPQSQSKPGAGRTSAAARADESQNRRGEGLLRLGKAGVAALGRPDGRGSLLADRYVEKSKIWASVTPMVLDHHPKKNKSPEDIIGGSCSNMGLPPPASVSFSRHSRIAGAPAAYAGKRARRGWMPPKAGFLDNKFLCHAVLEFDRHVCGPVILGAGRYYGLGLFVPPGGRR